MLVIDADMIVNGQLTVVGTVRLDGRFDGDIVCSRLEIGSDGYLFGTAVAHEVVVAGQIVGRVQARKIHLIKSAIVEGELQHEQLQMDETATLVGESRRYSRLEMPAVYRDLEVRARQADDDFKMLETESRVRRARTSRSR
jgi:cytoskeletal protein CcmA (bactofilin family)